MYSVKEAVRLAQESNDKICLKHALVGKSSQTITTARSWQTHV